MAASRTDSKIVILVRHGQSEGNVRGIISSAIEGYPLTEKGMAQAMKASEEIASLPKIDALYSSPVIRARQTAEIVGKRIGMDPVFDERLRERWFGLIEGKKEPDDNNEWKFNPKNQVLPWAELRKKMVSFVLEVPGNLVVAVSHGDNMSAICDWTDNKGERFHAPRCPRNCHFVIVDVSKGELIAHDVDEIPKDLIESLK